MASRSNFNLKDEVFKFMDANENPIEKIQILSITKFALIICAVGIVVTGLFSWIYDYIFTLSN